MLQRLLCMLVKEFLQMLRDPRMRVVIFGVPVIQMTIMAFALTTDVTDSNSTAIVQGYAGYIMSDYNDRMPKKRLAGKGIATMLFIFSLLLTSIGIVREKEIGTIEQVMVTPIRRLEFILGKTIPYMITGYISMSFMLAIAWIVFGVHVRGSLLLLYGLTGI